MGSMPTLPLRDLRKALREREDLLRAALARSLDAALGGAARDDEGVQDRKDQAGRRVDDTLAAAEARRELAELRAVVAALLRLDEGRYGDCRDCGAPIGAARLRVQPAATRCVECQGALERSARATPA